MSWALLHHSTTEVDLWMCHVGGGRARRQDGWGRRHRGLSWVWLVPPALVPHRVCPAHRQHPAIHAAGEQVCPNVGPISCCVMQLIVETLLDFYNEKSSHFNTPPPPQGIRGEEAAGQRAVWNLPDNLRGGYGGIQWGNCPPVAEQHAWGSGAEPGADSSVDSAVGEGS